MYFLVWRTVRAAAEGQKPRNVFFVKVVDSGRFYEGL
jgi:hypothetical protein